MADSTTNLNTISSGQFQKEVTANGLIDAESPASLFGRHDTATSALTWGYYGGKYKGNTIANGTLALAASTTNYVEADLLTGAVSSNTVGFTAARLPLYQVVTGASTITSYTDKREPGVASTMPPGISVLTWAASVTVNLAGFPDNLVYRLTLAGNTTLNIAGGYDGQRARIELRQDATGGRTVTLGTGPWDLGDLGSFTMSSGANKKDTLGVMYDGQLAAYSVLAMRQNY